MAGRFRGGRHRHGHTLPRRSRARPGRGALARRAPVRARLRLLVIAGSTGESPTLTHRGEAGPVRGGRSTSPRARARCCAAPARTTPPRRSSSSREAEDAGADGLLARDAVLQQAPAARTARALHAGRERRLELRSSPTTSPAAPGRAIEHDTLLRIAEVPNIVGVKDSTGDFQWISRLISEVSPDFEVYSGDDWATFGYMCLGAVGVVSVAEPPRGRDRSARCAT